MLRDEWKFEYPASQLAEAAQARLVHFLSRLDWWKSKKDQVLQTIRAEGLEIDEKLVLEYSSPKSRDWQNATRVSVRDDLRKDLEECLNKLAHHTAQVRTYTGWQEVLAANPDARLSLDHDDWQFFFSAQGQNLS